jgi:hypothetical protein
MTSDLLLALLSMDAYNHGFGAGVADVGSYGDSALNSDGGFGAQSRDRTIECTVTEIVQARVFPVRLKAEDWNSGDTHWLLDVIAPSQKVATAVLANFKQVVKDKPIRIHPLVSQLVDPAVLEKMKVRPVGEAEGKVESKVESKGQGT